MESISVLKMYRYYFEKLDVFKNSRELTNKIYIITSSYPSEEKFSLANQIRRSAVSVLANLVEGNSRVTKKDQANFTTISFSSLMELLSLIMVSFDQKFINKRDYEEIRYKINHISNQLIALRKVQLKKES